MDPKKWYLSKTIWLNLIMGILSAVVVAIPNANNASAWISAHMGEIGMGWGVLGVILRGITKGEISLID